MLANASIWNSQPNSDRIPGRGNQSGHSPWGESQSRSAVSFRASPSANSEGIKKERGTMSFKKSLVAVVVAMLTFLGVQGTASANGPSDPDFGGTVSAKEVLDLIVEASGATTERGIDPKIASVNRNALRIYSAGCADAEDWASYYIGQGRQGAKRVGIAGGTLCNGEKVFNTNPEYLPETKYVWGLMVDVTDRTMAQTNKKWFGMYFGFAIGKRIYSNGKTSVLEFGASRATKRSGESAIKFVRLVGPRVTIKLF